MIILKPFVRIILLSMILASLLIYLGIRYHWGDYLQPQKPSVVELPIPASTTPLENTLTTEPTVSKNNDFKLDIVNDNEISTILSSMNKEQITEQCTKFLSNNITDELTLELATVNCVVSNYQETFQNNTVSLKQAESLKKRKIVLQKQCQLQFLQNNAYSNIESQLLIGICVSDRLNQ